MLKKTLFQVLLRPLALVLLASALLVACNDSKPPTAPAHTVVFKIKDGPDIPSASVARGQKLARPTPPITSNYVLSKWYTDTGYTQEFDFDTPITASIILYAKWNPARTEAQLLSFSFRQADNEFSALEEGDRIVAGSINEAARVVAVTPSAYIHNWHVASLKAFFTLSPGAVARVVNVEQTSGVTANDFSGPISYEIVSEDGVSRRLYEVLVPTRHQLADIPDPVFRAYLKAKFPNAFDGEQLKIAHSDVTGYSGAIEVNYRDDGSTNGGGKIASLKGLEFFTAVTVLEASDNALTALDLSQNTALTALTLNNNNELSALDVTKNSLLNTINCIDNKLTAIDLSQNPFLTEAFCKSSTVKLFDLRGIRTDGSLPVLAANRYPALTEIKVHEAQKASSQLKTLKQDRGPSVRIAVYSAADGSTAYTLACADYDPNADACADATP